MQLRGSELVIGIEDAEAKYPVTIDPTWTEEAILSASDKSEFSFFGYSVSLSGDTAVVGAPYADPGALYGAGAAYVFTRSGSTWSEQAILSASDKSEFALFGYSVSVSGDTAIVGAINATSGGLTYAGQAYVFTRSGSTWSEQAILSASDKSSGAQFSKSVSVSGDTVVVGAQYANSGGVYDAGQAYVFTRNGSTWSQQATLSASDRSDAANFGYSVSVSGDTVVVGAMWANSGGVPAAGQAYVFTRSGSTWSEQAILSASNLSDYARFGGSVSLSGDTALVGASRANSGAENSAGAAYVFTRNGSTWSQQAILSASDTGGASFGRSVSLSGDTAVIGASGATSGVLQYAGQAYVFTRNGSTWSEQAILSASDKSEWADIGESVSVSGDTAIVGGPWTNSGEISYAGKVYVYRASSPIQASVSFGSASVTGGKSTTGTVTLASAPSANTVVTLSSDNAALSVPASVTIAAGSTTATFTATSSPVASDTLVSVTASGTGITSGTGQLTVRSPRIGGLTFSAEAVKQGQSATGTVTLQAAAPAGGMLVSFINGNSNALDCPATVTVPAGETRATFTVTGKPVGVATRVKVTGTPSFNNEKFATVTVHPSGLDAVSVSDFVLGFTGQGTVTLSSAAPTGGAVVSLSASSSKLSIPATVTVPAGETTASFSVGSTGVVQNATVRATYQGMSQTDTVSVSSNSIATVTTSAETVAVGARATITVTLSAAASQDLPIAISLQKAGVVSAPVQLVIPAGSISRTFEVTGLTQGVTNVYVRLLSQGVKSAKITVTNP